MDYAADINPEDLAAWQQKERSVTLTNAEWTKINTYILMTTKYRGLGEARHREKG